MAERKSNNYKSTILVQKTIDEEGFDPTVKGYQKKYIWAVCRYCGKSHRLLGFNYKKNKTDFHTDGSACHKECRLKEQSDAGSPFCDQNVQKKAIKNKTKYLTQEEINNRISKARKGEINNSIVKRNIDAVKTKNPIRSYNGDFIYDKEDLIDFYEQNMEFESDYSVLFNDRGIALDFHRNEECSELKLNKSEARKRQILKTKIAYQNNIQLLHIFEYTWRDRKCQVLNLLKSKLGINQKLFARKCNINNIHCPQFIENNHIQGKNNSTLRYFNLEYDGEIVGSMTAAKHHRINDLHNVVVLSRLCFKDGLTVVGGASRLLKAFCIWAKSEGYSKVISWSDTIYTYGDIYKSLGFKLVSELGVDYFYWDKDNHQYKSKQTQAKNKSNCPPHLTEREWAIERSLYRIWDCGKKRWEIDL